MRRLTALLTLSLTTLSLSACDRTDDERGLVDGQAAEAPVTAIPAGDPAEPVAAAPGKDGARDDKGGSVAADEAEAEAAPPAAPSAVADADAFGVGRSGGEGRARRVRRRVRRGTSALSLENDEGMGEVVPPRARERPHAPGRADVRAERHADAAVPGGAQDVLKDV